MGDSWTFGDFLSGVKPWPLYFTVPYFLWQVVGRG